MVQRGLFMFLLHWREVLIVILILAWLRLWQAQAEEAKKGWTFIMARKVEWNIFYSISMKDKKNWPLNSKKEAWFKSEIIN